MTTNGSNYANGQITTLTMALQSIIALAPGFRPLISEQIELAHNKALNDSRADDAFLSGMTAAREAILGENPKVKEIKPGVSMTNEEKQHIRIHISSLQAQLTPLDVFEAIRYGNETARGKKACDLLNAILMLEHSIGDRPAEFTPGTGKQKAA